MFSDKLGFSTILRFYVRESEEPLKGILALSLVAGVANAVLLSLINAASQSAANKEVSVRLFVLFGLALLLFIFAKKNAMERAAKGVEHIIRKVRMRIIDKIRRAELVFMEGLDPTNIYTRLGQETALLSEAALVIINAIQSSILVVVCLIYVGIISLPALAVTVICIVVGVAVYLLTSRELNENLWRATRKEADFYESLSHVLHGFKELKVNSARSADLYAATDGISRENEEIKVKTAAKLVMDFMYSQVFFYTLLGLVIFGLPWHNPANSSEVMKLTATILFIIGPLTMVVASISIFAKAGVSIENLYELEGMLDRSFATFGDTATAPLATFTPFKELSLVNAGYTYRDHGGGALFELGPLDITVRQGEVLFIVGGNGSGKSSLLKLLTGLYRPMSGWLLVDGVTVAQHHYHSYRQMFSVIFSDFHIFDRLYGLPDVDERRVHELLVRMQLDKKTAYRNGRFINQELSTGQRKRLALIVAFLEDKPVYVFDEWAADQDPQFRKYFYEEILQDLKARNKTVIAVTHDDRYFAAADRVVRMEYGRITEA